MSEQFEPELAVDPPIGRSVAVVGAGLGGLAASCTLAARGHRVTCFERNAWLGGKAAVLEADGFRFDMGPTILTVPSVLERVFAEANRPMADYLDLIRLDPQWRCFYNEGASGEGSSDKYATAADSTPDGSESGAQLDLYEDPERMASEIARFTGRPELGDGYRRFMGISRELKEISDRFFFWRSVGSVRDTFEPGSAVRLSVLPALLKLRMGRTVAGLVRQCVPEERVAQMLDHLTQYVGSSPELAPAVLCGIADMQSTEGITYPRGGTGAVPAALRRLGEDLGVIFRTGSRIERIIVQSAGEAGRSGRRSAARCGRVTGIETAEGEQLSFDAVVSNMDSVRTHVELLARDAPNALERFRGRRCYEPACSGVVLYLGLKQRYEHLAHHNFVFSRDAHEEFEAIYGRGEPAPDPTCYVCAPSGTDPSVAPDGGEALYVLVHTPYLRPGHDWSAMLPDYRRQIIRKLATTGHMPDLEDRIVYESTLTPQGINDRYQVLDGAIYGLASHGRWTGAFKPANRSPDVAGLYLAGGSAHPGPGMPMALMSGWIAADSLDQDARG